MTVARFAGSIRPRIERTDMCAGFCLARQVGTLIREGIRGKRPASEGDQLVLSQAEAFRIRERENRIVGGQVVAEAQVFIFAVRTGNGLRLIPGPVSDIQRGRCDATSFSS